MINGNKYSIKYVLKKALNAVSLISHRSHILCLYQIA